MKQKSFCSPLGTPTYFTKELMKKQNICAKIAFKHRSRELQELLYQLTMESNTFEYNVKVINTHIKTVLYEDVLYHDLIYLLLHCTDEKIIGYLFDLFKRSATHNKQNLLGLLKHFNENKKAKIAEEITDIILSLNPTREETSKIMDFCQLNTVIDKVMLMIVANQLEALLTVCRTEKKVTDLELVLEYCKDETILNEMFDIYIGLSPNYDSLLTVFNSGALDFVKDKTKAQLLMVLGCSEQSFDYIVDYVKKMKMANPNEDVDVLVGLIQKLIEFEQ